MSLILSFSLSMNFFGLPDLINFVSILKPNGKSFSIFLHDVDRSLWSSSNEMHVGGVEGSDDEDEDNESSSSSDSDAVDFRLITIQWSF